MTGGATGLSIGPISASYFAQVVGLPVELVRCPVAGCSSPDTMHHHHASVARRRSPWACRCTKPRAR